MKSPFVQIMAGSACVRASLLGRLENESAFQQKHCNLGNKLDGAICMQI